MAVARISVAHARKIGIIAPRKLRRGPKRIPQLEDILSQPRLRGMTFTEEQRLSYDLYQQLLFERRMGRLRCVFSCVPAELPIPTWTPELKKMAATIQLKRQAMGVIAGVPDWFFMWPGGGGLIELKIPQGPAVMKVVDRVGGAKLHPVKRPAGRLNESQVSYRDWCAELNVPHAVAHSVEEALHILRSWGALAAS